MTPATPSPTREQRSGWSTTALATAALTALASILLLPVSALTVRLLTPHQPLGVRLTVTLTSTVLAALPVTVLGRHRAARLIGEWIDRVIDADQRHETITRIPRRPRR